MPIRILICGSRNWSNIAAIERELLRHVPCAANRRSGFNYHPSQVTIIHGACRGADLLAAAIAHGKGFSVAAYPADWQNGGLSAGPRRNQEMIAKGKPDIVLAFHENLEDSKGTKDMVTRAVAAGVEVKIFTE